MSETVPYQFKEDSMRAALRALRGLEQTAIMLETHGAESLPVDEAGKKHFARVIMESAARSIRDSWSNAIADVETRQRLAGDPVELLSAEAAREEVRYWRAEAAAGLQAAMSLMKLLRKTGAEEEASRVQVFHLAPLRAALDGALNGEYHQACENCSRAVRPGDLVVRFEDVGEVHAGCAGVAGDDLRVGFEIPVDAAMLDLEEGETAPANPTMRVYASVDPYTSAKVAAVLAEAWAFDREPACRICGCTEDNACIIPDVGPCSWVEPDLCNNPQCVAAAAKVSAAGVEGDPAGASS